MPSLCHGPLWPVRSPNAVDQPVSNRRWRRAPMPSVVPPTAVTSGSEAGVTTPGSSPEIISRLTPSAAARSAIAWLTFSSDRGTLLSLG